MFDESNTDQPIKQAIEWCIENNILKEFFETRGQEVLKAMTIDMTWEHREELIRRDEREEGKQEGAREQQKLDQVIIDAKDEELNAKDEELNAKDKELAKYRAFILEHGLNPDTV